MKRPMSPKRACHPLSRLCSITGGKKLGPWTFRPRHRSRYPRSVCRRELRRPASVSVSPPFRRDVRQSHRQTYDGPSEPIAESTARIAFPIGRPHFLGIRRGQKIRVPVYYRLEHEISGSLRRQYTKIVLPPLRNKLFLTTLFTAPLEIQTPHQTR